MQLPACLLGSGPFLQGPVESGLRCSPVVLEESAPSLLPVAFQNSSSSCPLHALSESQPTSACMLSAKRTGVAVERDAESRKQCRRASRLKKGRARPGQARSQEGRWTAQVAGAGRAALAELPRCS